MKKTLSILLTLSLLFTSSISVFAADSESKELENAILYVKSIINIPEDFTEFSQSSYQEEREDKTTVTIWNLNWSDKEDTGHLNASVDNKGNFIRYRFYEEKEEKGLSKITRQAGEKTALAFLKKVIPQYAKDFRQVNEIENQMRTYDLLYTFQPYVNDVPLRFIDISIIIDKYYGQVTSFSRDSEPFQIDKIPSKEGMLSKEEADQAYFKEFGMDLNYYSYYDWKKDTLNVFPAYVNTAKKNQALDAKTGKAVKIYLPIIHYGRSGITEDAELKNDAGLTPKEQEQVDNISGLISKEEADSILKNTFGDIGYSSTFKSSLHVADRNPNKGQYIWNLSYENANGSVDAKTGEILSYYYYDVNNYKGNLKINEQNALSKAESLLSKILPKDKLDSVKRAENEYNEESSYYNIRYYRQVNGIDFFDNYVWITVNRDNGKITGYNSEWYDNVAFPSIEKAMDEQQAYQAYKKLSPFSLNYEKVEKNKALLVYNFDFVDEECLIQPETGTRLDWMGKPYKEDKGVPEYSDIKGHWCESVVNQLKENGFYLDGEEFLPNNKITQKDFLIYLYPYYRNLEDEELYEELIRDGILKEGEENPNANLSRQEAAKIMIRFLRLEKAAEHPELFQSVFKDKVDYSYRGYATLCKGLGILSGDKHGKFNGKNTMTRAEAASAIHRLLNITN
ncbi:YcdB/YcdC domain-containing protein [Anaerovorax sp. IOR16]|uniref:YcdB/YcdC domain-containing protein n=1 Tax=Anaerovorax sp. IOR16 TaxID=2773458 RepID=UPI0019D046AC|nr:S-layer homology domain-containing protein [Anaerovorax sp. IOR16]